MINKDLISTAYGQLKKVNLTKLKPVEEELKLLGIKHNKDDILVSYEVVKKSKSLKEAVEKVENLNKESYKNLLDEALEEIEGIKKEEVREEKEKKEKEGLAEERKQEIEEIADASNEYKRIYAYTVVGGKSKNELINEVSKYMSDGWIPYGGVSAAAFGMSPVGGNQYIQALVRFR